jgi:hypothetical protein
MVGRAEAHEQARYADMARRMLEVFAAMGHAVPAGTIPPAPPNKTDLPALRALREGADTSRGDQ